MTVVARREPQNYEIVFRTSENWGIRNIELGDWKNSSEPTAKWFIERLSPDRFVHNTKRLTPT
jgi:hypothetical protein